MNKTTRQNARALLTQYLGRPVTEEHRFAPSRTRLAIYHIAGFYWSAPPLSEPPPKEWQWQHMAKVDGRLVYRSDHLPEKFR